MKIIIDQLRLIDVTNKFETLVMCVKVNLTNFPEIRKLINIFKYTWCNPITVVVANNLNFIRTNSDIQMNKNLTRFVMEKKIRRLHPITNYNTVK